MLKKFEFAQKQGQNNFYCPTRIEEQTNGGYVAEIAHFKVTFDDDGDYYPEMGSDYVFSGGMNNAIHKKERELENQPDNQDLRQELVALRFVDDLCKQLRRGDVTIDEVNDQLLEKSIAFRNLYMSGDEVGDVSQSEINTFLNIPSV